MRKVTSEGSRNMFRVSFFVSFRTNQIQCFENSRHNKQNYANRMKIYTDSRNGRCCTCSQRSWNGRYCLPVFTIGGTQVLSYLHPFRRMNTEESNFHFFLNFFLFFQFRVTIYNYDLHYFVLSLLLYYSNLNQALGYTYFLDR